MKRLSYSLVVLAAAAAFAIGFSNAFFSDQETSNNNTFTAGDLDLKVDNTSYYNGAFNAETSWTLADLSDGQGPSGGGTYKFLNFLDIKPSDWGEDTISLHVETNDAWGCYDVTLTSNHDNTYTEPEIPDDQTVDQLNPTTTAGELGDTVEFALWKDDGDNVYETGEGPILKEGTLNAVIPTLTGALADSTGGLLGLNGQPIDGETTYYLGKLWCFGDLTLSAVAQDGLGFVANTGANGPDVRNSGIDCDGSGLNNATQTDILTADIEFSVVQSRNNPGFTCDGPTPSASITPSNTPTATPTPLACINNADVMLVLDRSGSINASELASLKTAANDFVTALSPSDPGAKVGMASFATTASLNQILTFNGASVQAAINSLVATGFTNLLGGINTASTELAGVNDRLDATSPDYMVIVTDGHPNRPLPEATADDQALAAATAFKGTGGTVYVVGVGSDVNTPYLQSVATSNAHYFPVTNYSDLQTALAQISTACVTPTPPNN